MAEYKSLEEFIAESEAYRKTWRGKMGILFGQISYKFAKPRIVKGDIVNFIQRGKRGYGYKDLWSADTYLANVISGILRAYAKEKSGVGYPYTAEGVHVDDAYVAMQADYRLHAAMFEEYAKNGYAHSQDWKDKFGGLTEKELKDAMVWLADRYAGLWD